jgi:pimeloyl-ACP methyl ester carboxylesterase
VGEGNPKELIFVHGGGSSRKLFLPHAKELAKKGFKSILIDLPAHGARFKEDLTIETCVEVIKEAIGMCRTKDFTIIGGSLGGYIIMEFIGR